MTYGRRSTDAIAAEAEEEAGEISQAAPASINRCLAATFSRGKKETGVRFRR